MVGGDQGGANMTGDKHEGGSVSLERDEDKARSEAKLGKIAKAKFVPNAGRRAPHK